VKSQLFLWHLSTGVPNGSIDMLLDTTY